MGKNATPEQSERTKTAMRALFDEAVENAGRFSILYAFGMDVSVTTFIVRETTYTYASYILGYDRQAKEIVLVEITPELDETGEVLPFPRERVVKGTYRRMRMEYTIRDTRLRKGYIQFCVPYITDDEELYPPILQEEEGEAFNAFFMEHFAEASGGGFFGKLTKLFGG